MNLLISEKPPLNLKLRGWQKDCIGDQFSKIHQGKKSYFIGAGVGSGKTLLSLATFIMSGFDLMVVVTPKSGIRGSWRKDSNRIGLKLETLTPSCLSQYDSNRKLPNGFVLNIHAVPGVIDELNTLCDQFRVMLVIDEAHHFGEDMSWTNNVLSAFERVDYSLHLSGTPYRSDDQKILGLSYGVDGDSENAAPDYVRSYEKNVSAGESAPIVTRFVAGRVHKIMGDGRVETFDYADGDYSGVSGKPNESLMAERLRLTAIESIDWQMGAIQAARAELMRFRRDGNSWGGLIVCRTIEQAKQIAGKVTSEFGDKVKLIVAEVETEDAVNEFNDDESYTWAVSITKVSEGINIDRLRVGVMLTSILTRGHFEQVRGRLARLRSGVAHLSQVAYFYVPADPRLIEYALSSNKTMLHSIPWLSDGDDVVVLHDELAGDADRDIDGTHADRQKTTKKMISSLREELAKSSNAVTVDIGGYTLSAKAVIDGAAFADQLIAEDKFLAVRKSLAEIINPMTAMRANGDALLAMSDLFGVRHG